MALQATAPSLRRILAPLALAQFICSFAGSNMNVMLKDISDDLHTTVAGVQLCITLFLLVMAALMIPGGKLTDRWGRKRCFTMGLGIYAIGAITTAISWRAAFAFQAIVVVVIWVLARRIPDPLPADPTRPFDLTGTVLSALGLIVLVLGILAADRSLTLTAVLIVIGAAILALFFWWIVRREREGREPLLSISLFHNRTSNLGMITQNMQWLILMGVSFVVSAYLQVVRGYNAIQTGVIFTAATVGILVSSLAAGPLAKRFAQRTLILTGFITTAFGIVFFLSIVRNFGGPWAFAPGLLLIGLGLGVMLTPSVNVVQFAFPEEQQGEISGLSRCVSNLGSSMGTAVAGTILVSGLADGSRAYGYAMLSLGVAALIGIGATLAIRNRDVGTGMAAADPAATPSA